LIAGLVSHYRVVSTLGAGGMGVVYKAIDTRLNRPVAIKAIADKHGLDTSATLRLRREALAAASLDHPYICKIYELLETDSGTLIVMEFVEGETLAVVLERGVPPLVDALRYGAETAEGLANAHAHGLVHRDIKPSNIMVTRHGHVKLLDFGIVRSNDPGSGVTETQGALTLPGAVAGSPFYMSPEQALGQPVDGRSDLFSLGTVLYQCLTGELPFEGKTRDGYVQAMLHGRVRPIDQLAPAIPPAVRKVVLQCLENDRTRRMDSAAAVATELGRAADALSGSGVVAAAARPRSHVNWGLQVAAVVVAVTALAGAYRLWRASQAASDSTRRTMIAAVTWPSAEFDPRVSPDGRWLSFLSDRDGAVKLFVQPIDGGNATPIKIAAAAVLSHAWSPDGKEIACVARHPLGTTLHVLSAFSGGPPRISVPIEPAPEDVRVLRWIGDEVFLYGNLGFAGRPLWRVTLATGARQDLTKTWPATTPAYRTIDVSPDGREVVFLARHEGQTDLWTAHINGASMRRLTNDANIERDPVWIGNTGRIAFQSGASGQVDLWEIDNVSGRVAQMTSSPTIESPSGASPDGGVLAFEQTAQSATLWMLDPKGVSRQLTSDALSDFWPSLSGDGTRLAFQRAGTTVREGIQYFDSRVLVMPVGAGFLQGPPAAGSLPPAQPQSVSDGFGARLSPDGVWVAYLQRSADPAQMILQAKNIRTGESRTVWDRCLPVGLSNSLPVDWAVQQVVWRPHSTELLFVGLRDGHQFIGRANLASSAAADVLVQGSAATILDLRPSADGRVLAYLARRGDPSERRAQFEVHSHDLTTGSDTLVGREQVPETDNLMLSGWIGTASVLLLRSHPKASSAFDVEVSELTLAGAKRLIGTIEDAFVTTARLDGPGARLLITRMENGVHNIFALRIAGGGLQRLTENPLPGVSFAGIEPTASGAIVYSRPEWRRDIWLARKSAQ
jgi:Tol biopolymer transport system component